MSLAVRRPIDEVRIAASGKLDPQRRVEYGQFMTPSVIADFMASLFKHWPSEVRLLDPGAGIGSLTDAFVRQWLAKSPGGAKINLSAYEIEPVLLPLLGKHFQELCEQTKRSQRTATSNIVARDFIAEASFAFGFGGNQRFTHVIMNPPYKKIGVNSEWRRSLSHIGVETVNLYTAFLALAVVQCEEGGEIVAIVPRSFCNGAYFRPFREWLLERAAITHLHVFESRKKAFQDDEVLQENIIIHLHKGGVQGHVTVSTSHDSGFTDYSERSVPFSEIVKPLDAERFIYIPTVEDSGESKLFRFTLHELGLDVATGPVVDFRVREHCHDQPKNGSVPLLYSHHFGKGMFQWPREHRKPNAIAVNDDTRKWLMPQGWYALTKRFSSKEEKRRVVAYVLDPTQLPFDLYGFENHLNVIHCDKNGLPEDLARGIALFLNSTPVDTYFRSFSGHTQVNATDLRTMRFPDKETLVRFGKWAKNQGTLTQEGIDIFLESNHARHGSS